MSWTLTRSSLLRQDGPVVSFPTTIRPYSAKTTQPEADVQPVVNENEAAKPQLE